MLTLEVGPSSPEQGTTPPAVKMVRRHTLWFAVLGTAVVSSTVCWTVAGFIAFGSGYESGRRELEQLVVVQPIPSTTGALGLYTGIVWTEKTPVGVDVLARITIYGSFGSTEYRHHVGHLGSASNQSDAAAKFGVVSWDADAAYFGAAPQTGTRVLRKQLEQHR